MIYVQNALHDVPKCSVVNTNGTNTNDAMLAEGIKVSTITFYNKVDSAGNQTSELGGAKITLGSASVNGRHKDKDGNIVTKNANFIRINGQYVLGKFAGAFRASELWRFIDVISKNSAKGMAGVINDYAASFVIDVEVSDEVVGEDANGNETIYINYELVDIKFQPTLADKADIVNRYSRINEMQSMTAMDLLNMFK